MAIKGTVGLSGHPGSGSEHIILWLALAATVLDMKTSMLTCNQVSIYHLIRPDYTSLFLNSDSKKESVSLTLLELVSEHRQRFCILSYLGELGG